jgi:hypothetical protein
MARIALNTNPVCRRPGRDAQPERVLGAPAPRRELRLARPETTKVDETCANLPRRAVPIISKHGRAVPPSQPRHDERSAAHDRGGRVTLLGQATDGAVNTRRPSNVRTTNATCSPWTPFPAIARARPARRRSRAARESDGQDRHCDACSPARGGRRASPRVRGAQYLLGAHVRAGRRRPARWPAPSHPEP